jgi:hypothetical protein
MKNKIPFLLNLLFILNSFSQTKTAIIDKNIDQVVNKFSNYKNELGNEDITAGTDSEMSTTYKIRGEDYFKQVELKYLKLVYNNNSSSSSIVDSDWDIQFKKISDQQTECSITLKKIIPRAGLKSNIILKESTSTGRLEKEIIDFINDVESNGIENTDNSEKTNAVEENTITAAFENFGSLLNEKKIISLPTTLANFEEKIGSKANVLRNEACENDEYYSWTFSNGINLIYYKLKNQNQAYSLSYFGDDVIDGLPLDLSFKKSSLQECKIKYAKYGAKSHQESETDPNTNETHTYSIVDFKSGQYFVTLGFYDNKYLSSIQLSTSK